MQEKFKFEQEDPLWNKTGESSSTGYIMLLHFSPATITQSKDATSWATSMINKLWFGRTVGHVQTISAMALPVSPDQFTVPLMTRVCALLFFSFRVWHYFWHYLMFSSWLTKQLLCGPRLNCSSYWSCKTAWTAHDSKFCTLVVVTVSPVRGLKATWRAAAKVPPSRGPTHITQRS